MAVIGYKLVRTSDGEVVNRWGGSANWNAGIPNPVFLPNGDHVHAPSLDQNYGGYTLAAWEAPVTMDDVVSAVASHVETVAQSRQYDSSSRLVGYANSSVDKWRNEAAAFIAWRDSVWLYVFDQEPKISTGSVPNTVEEFIAELPQIVWPE